MSRSSKERQSEPCSIPVDHLGRLCSVLFCGNFPYQGPNPGPPTSRDLVWGFRGRHPTRLESQWSVTLVSRTLTSLLSSWWVTVTFSLLHPRFFFQTLVGTVNDRPGQSNPKTKSGYFTYPLQVESLERWDSQEKGRSRWKEDGLHWPIRILYILHSNIYYDTEIPNLK